MERIKKWFKTFKIRNYTFHIYMELYKRDNKKPYEKAMKAIKELSPEERERFIELLKKRE